MGNWLIRCVTCAEGTEEDVFDRFRSGEIQRSFHQSYQNAPVIRLAEGSKLIAFSDVHRGNGDEKSDLSMGSAKAYRNALRYYYRHGYILVHNGDIEDAWMHPNVQQILDVHRKDYLLEQQFHKQRRYIRTVGNHDDIWYDAEKVAQHLGPLFPGLVVHDAVRLALSNTELFVLHGHQGSYNHGTVGDCCAKSCIGDCFTPLMACCNSDKKSYQVPSTNDRLSNQLDLIANRWSKNNKIRTIMSHTHSPVIHDQPTLATGLMLPTKVCNHNYYFNTGCCCINDGSITGLEIADGSVRLVKFVAEDTIPEILDTVRYF